MELPLPKNWQDFENIVLAAQMQRWRSTGLQKNGRPGQKQHGVDIYGPDDIGRRVGIQCKRFKGALELKTVNTEIANAEKFEGSLSALFIATTADHDATLQQQVRLVSDARVAAGKFAVSVLFWDDIVGGLTLNPAVLNSIYPQIHLSAPRMLDKERLTAALELGYYGPYLWEYVLLTFGEFGFIANTDPDTINVITQIVERRATQVLNPSDVVVLIESSSAVRSGCCSEKNKSSDWNEIEAHAKRVATRVKAASSLLPIQEGNVLEMGISLGRIYHHVDDRPASSVINDIRRRLKGILPQSCHAAIEQKIKAASKATSGYGWAPSILNFLDREIRWSDI